MYAKSASGASNRRLLRRAVRLWSGGPSHFSVAPFLCRTNPAGLKSLPLLLYRTAHSRNRLRRRYPQTPHSAALNSVARSITCHPPTRCAWRPRKNLEPMGSAAHEGGGDHGSLHVQSARNVALHIKSIHARVSRFTAARRPAHFRLTRLTVALQSR